MIEVAILFTILGVASRKEVRNWIKWRLDRPAPDFSDPEWPIKLDNWKMNRP